MMSAVKGCGFDLNDLLEGGAVLLVFTPSVHDDDYIRQKDALAEQAASLADLGVELIEVLGEDVAACACGTMLASAARSLREQFSPHVQEFSVVLVGRDGEIAMREHQPIDADRLLEILNTLNPRDIHLEYASQA